VGEGLASTAKYKMVCFGHSHVYIEQKVGNTILLNPGEIMGKERTPKHIVASGKGAGCARQMPWHVTRFHSVMAC